MKDYSHSQITDITENLVRRFAPNGIRRIIRSAECLVGRNPQFVIVSTGRAGSTYTASLLSKADVKCSHEMWFTPSGFYKNLRHHGDSSWLAVPYLEENPNLTEKVVHQVRNPLDVVSSLYGIGFFEPENSNSFNDFVRRSFQLTGNPLIDCVRFWTEWNTRCEEISEVTYLFEDLLNDPCVVFSALDIQIDNQKIARLKDVSKKKINSRRRVEIGLVDIPEGREKRDMIDLARKYGYQLS